MPPVIFATMRFASLLEDKFTSAPAADNCNALNVSACLGFECHLNRIEFGILDEVEQWNSDTRLGDLKEAENEKQEHQLLSSGHALGEHMLAPVPSSSRHG